MNKHFLNTSDYIRNLYVKPNYAVLIPPPFTGSRTKTEARIQNESNLRANKTKGTLSDKSRKRLLVAINWLILASQKKRIFCNKSNKWVNFRLSFVTLTIPQTSKTYSDHFYKKNVLHPFLSNLVKNYGLRNYVWKAERHKDNTIHFHLTADSYVHWSAIRSAWNSILKSRGLLDDYQAKMSQLSLDEYIALRAKEDNFDLEQVKKAFQIGCAENWSNPNSTDVHSVRGVKNLAAYLADYMAKKEEGKDKIEGRQWGCNYALSRAGADCIEVSCHSEDNVLQDLRSKVVEVVDIFAKDKFLSVGRQIGSIFFWKLTDIGTYIHRGLFDYIRREVFLLRNHHILQV